MVVVGLVFRQLSTLLLEMLVLLLSSAKSPKCPDSLFLSFVFGVPTITDNLNPKIPNQELIAAFGRYYWIAAMDIISAFDWL